MDNAIHGSVETEQKKEQTISFHNTPSFTREFVNNWLTHTKKHNHPPAHVAVLEDVIKLIDVALTILEPGPAAPATEKK